MVRSLLSTISSLTWLLSLMSCPIHDRCICYVASLPCNTLAADFLELIPQANNIFVGYDGEWSAPLPLSPAVWYPESPYFQGVSQMTIPSDRPELLVQAHRNSTSGFGFDNLDYNELPVLNSGKQSLAFDEPLLPYYPNNSLPVSDVFPQSALLPTDHHLSVGQITQSSLTPIIPLDDSSIYQYPASPALGTMMLQSRVSSIEPLARQASLSCIPVLGNAHGYMIGASESAMSTMSASQIPTTSLTVVAADQCSPLPQAHPPVSPTTPPCASVPVQNGSVVTPLQARTLVPSPLEVDSNTFPCIRKVSSPPRCPS